ncbi:hypothetical protein BDP67DRAFT_490229 [Colletotrichum lupini]|nr:hypothetical protein BDP67DRAFT_490229 [Colletotrichum lupini]
MKRFLKAGASQNAKIRNMELASRLLSYPPFLVSPTNIFRRFFYQEFDEIFVTRCHKKPAVKIHRLRRAMPDELCLTPLSIAVHQANYEAFTLLCNHKPNWKILLNPELLDAEGKTRGVYWRLCDMALDHDDEEMLLRVLPTVLAMDLGYLVRFYTRLTLASLMNHDFLRVAALFLRHLSFNNYYMVIGNYFFFGADVNVRWTYMDGRTALMHALYLSINKKRRPDFFADWAALLVHHGANVDDDRGLGHTLLIEACYMGIFDQARVLLSIGASPTTAFIRAGCPVLVQRSLSQGGVFHMRCNGNGLQVQDFTPLEIACLPSMHAFSYGLLRYSARGDAQAEARYQIWHASRLAFVKSIAPTLTGAFGQLILRTALSIAAEGREVDLVRALLEAGAGLTGGRWLSLGRIGHLPPLVVALRTSEVFRYERGHAEKTARLLLESGADVRDLDEFPDALWKFDQIFGIPASDYKRPER